METNNSPQRDHEAHLRKHEGQAKHPPRSGTLQAPAKHLVCAPAQHKVRVRAWQPMQTAGQKLGCVLGWGRATHTCRVAAATVAVEDRGCLVRKLVWTPVSTSLLTQVENQEVRRASGTGGKPVLSELPLTFVKVHPPPP